MRRPAHRWFKYAGNWRPSVGEAWSYGAQRWLLESGLHRGQVTVNGCWPGQRPFVHSFYNPSLTDDELARAAAAAAGKEIRAPLLIVFVGRLTRSKGALRLVEIAAGLRDAAVEFALHVVGDGPERESMAAAADAQGVKERFRLHGWMKRNDIDAIYAESHLQVLPSISSEGWPKVLGEGMAWGVVPVASDISSIPSYLSQCQCGAACAYDDAKGFCSAIQGYAADPTRWKRESMAASTCATRFGYTHYLNRVRELFGTA